MSRFVAQGLAPGITATLTELMEHDPRIVLLGEDIGRLGGVFRVTRGLQDRFGQHRVRDTTLAESSIIGQAIGMSLAGLVPICEIQFDGFTFPATNQLVTQATRLATRWGDPEAGRVIVRIPTSGGTRGVEHHSESNEGIFAAVPGVTVASPSTVEDYREVMHQAITLRGPVLVYEPIRLYWRRPPSRPLAQPAATRTSARVARPGTDLTVVTYGAMTDTVLRVAEEIAGDIDVEVVDLRWVSPVDEETILASVRRTQRLVTVQESSAAHGIGAEVTALVAEHLLHHLKSAPRRLGAPPSPIPPADTEHRHVVQPDQITQTLQEVMS